MSLSQSRDAEIQSRDTEIQRLTKDVGDTRGRADFWDKLTIMLLWAAAGVALLLAVFAVVLFRAKNKLISEQDELATAKEAKLALVLQDGEDKLEKERIARIKLQAYAAWRTVTDKQEEIIVEHLKSLRGQALNMFVFTDDPETAAFADRLGTVLSKVMKVHLSSYPGHGILPRAGLSFTVGKGREKDFEQIAEALDMAGIDKADILRKRVEHKPPDDGLEISIEEDIEVGKTITAREQTFLLARVVWAVALFRYPCFLRPFLKLGHYRPGDWLDTRLHRMSNAIRHKFWVTGHGHTPAVAPPSSGSHLPAAHPHDVPSRC